MTRPIYVETRIHGSLDELWRRTQSPELHERWDLRFTQIHYLPRHDNAMPQRFRYTTRIGFGIAISGEGETAGNRSGPDGQQTSALRFWSASPLSLIRTGAGYWKYLPTADGIRFITAYDYEVRFGWLGRLCDRIVFRRVIGWATAWSFDRLRLWIEQEQAPETAFWRCVVFAACLGRRAAPAIPRARTCLRQRPRGER